MAQTDREALIRQITREVLRVLEQPPQEEIPAGPAALLIGESGTLPAHLREQYRLVPLEAWSGEGVDAVLITALTLTQLADIALGRDDGAVQRAVIQGLAEGVPVLLWEAALPHRLWVRREGALYRMLEGYVTALQSFGVTLMNDDPPGAVPASTACAFTGKLVTEAVALRLIAESDGDICLVGGALLTPSARDVLRHAGRQVTFAGAERPRGGKSC